MAVSQARLEQVVAMHGGANKVSKIKKARVSEPVDGVETGTGIYLPDNCLVEDVWVKVITTDAGGTLDVGTDGDASNDANGYLTGISVASDASTALRFGTLASGVTETLGVLLQETGASSALRIPDVYSGGEQVTVTHTQGANATDIEVYVKYIEF